MAVTTPARVEFRCKFAGYPKPAGVWRQCFPRPARHPGGWHLHVLGDSGYNGNFARRRAASATDSDHLSDEADVVYQCTDYYSPEHERTILWSDPQLAIEWPVTDPLLSEKDQRGVPLAAATVF